MRKILILASFVILTACSATNQVIKDTSPEHKTVVLNAKGVVNGYVFPDYNFKQVVYTRPDRRTVAMDGKYDSWMARQFLGEVKDTVIFRMDRNLRWMLIQQKNEKKYLECELSGCNVKTLLQIDKKQDAKNDNKFDYAPDKAGECKLNLTKNTFTVKATGQRRKIAGYWAREYKGVWLIEYKDDRGRVDRNQLNLVFWNTEPTPVMNEAWKINGQATRAYLSSIKQGNNPLAKYLPDNIFMGLSAFSGDTSKKGRAWRSHIARELAIAKGYPLSIKIEWYLDRNACVQAKPAKKSLDWSNPLQALKDSATQYAGKEAKKMFMPNPHDPVFRYIYDVTRVAIEPVHDSVFEVPAGYRLVSRE